MIQPLLYKHEFDRFAILEELIAFERKQKAMDQKKLAGKSEVKQSDISNIEHLSNGVKESRYRVRRSKLLKVLAYGLRLPQEKIESALWLYDGNLLNKKELKDDIPKRASTLQLRDRSLEEIRDQTLDWLKEATDSISSRTSSKISVEMTTYGGDEERVKVDRQIYKLESQPGTRLVVLQCPSTLLMLKNFPEKNFLKIETASESTIEIISIKNKRVDEFEKNLEIYGERCIYSKDFIEKRFLNKNFEWVNGRKLEHRVESINNMIRLLHEYSDFEVAFTNPVPYIEMFVKSRIGAIIRGATNYGESEERASWGIRHLYFSDSLVSLKFVSEFEQYWWKKLTLEERDKNKTIEWLVEQLEIAEKKN